jgi:hypothetical protein
VGLALIHRIHNTAVTAESLWAERCALLHEIVLAKHCTTIKRGTLAKFNARWKHLVIFTVSIHNLIHTSFIKFTLPLCHLCFQCVWWWMWYNQCIITLLDSIRIIASPGRERCIAEHKQYKQRRELSTSIQSRR